jgi:hypothetical protein
MKVAERQLSNPAFYLHVEENLMEKHNIDILKFIDKMHEDG